MRAHVVSCATVLRDEIRQLLQELTGAVGAEHIAIVPDARDDEANAPASPIRAEGHLEEPPQDQSGDQNGDQAAEGHEGAAAHVLARFPLGRSTSLQLALPMPETPGPRPAQLGDVLNMDQRMAVERTVRAIRAAVRRWQAERAPAMTVTAAEPPPPPRERVRERMQIFLHALANIHGAANVLVTLRGDVVTSSLPLEPLQQARIPFTLRRVGAEAARQPSRSHAELVGEDFYAASFWFDACLIGFFSGPYAVDFFRHRARMVIRELSQLLPLFDEPPPSPAQQAPIPE